MESGNPPIPLALGNRWTYVDSLYANSGLVVDTISVLILSSRRDNVGLWWKISQPFNPSIAAVEFMASQDSIFSLQYAESPSGGLTSIRSLEYLSPLGSGPIAYDAILDGDVVIRKSILRSTNTLSTKAGMFSTSLRVNYNIGGEEYKESVVPGVGMVDLEIVNNSTIPAYQWWTRRRIQLLEFHVLQ